MTRATILLTGVLLGIVFSLIESSWAQPLQRPPKKQEWKIVLEVENELTFKDPVDPVPNERENGCRHKVHPFKMVAGRTYQIDLVSLTQTRRPGRVGIW